nr:respiratory nitrate reductase subunit gamma [Nonomuraea basaltis]
MALGEKGNDVGNGRAGQRRVAEDGAAPPAGCGLSGPADAAPGRRAPGRRLVHMLPAPVGYLTRPYIIYRSRDEARPPARRGWEPSR